MPQTEPREDPADESRQRFVAGKFRTEMMTACPKVSWDDREWIIAAFVSEIEAAERDTRELCVEQVLALRDKTSTGAYWEALNTVAEAIRKGGE